MKIKNVSHGNALETGGTSGLESQNGQGFLNSFQEMFKAIMECVGKLPEETQPQAIARISDDLDSLWRDVAMGEENASLSPSASYVMEASPSYSPPNSPMDDMDLHGTILKWRCCGSVKTQRSSTSAATRTMNS